MIAREIVKASLGRLSLTALLLCAVVGAWTGLMALNEARNRVAALDSMLVRSNRAMQSTPDTPSREPDARSEAAKISARLRDAATRHGLLVERMELLPEETPLPFAINAHVTVSGTEADVMRYIAHIEGGRPTTRFTEWRIHPAEGGAIRLEGRAAMPWLTVP